VSYTPPLDGFKPSLFSKIAEVQGEIHAMQPDETVKTDKYSYSYISESQLLAAVRAKLSTRKVAAFVSVDSQHTDLVEAQRTRNDGGTYTVQYAASEITLRIVFADGESGETFTIFGQGRANDAGDKSVYKAITSANRYAWWKTMLVPTGDDDVNKDSGRVDGLTANGQAPLPSGGEPEPAPNEPAFVAPAPKKPTPAKLKAFVEVVNGLIADGAITAEQVGRAAAGKIAAGRPLREEEEWPVLADALNQEQVESLMTRLTTFMANLEKEKAAAAASQTDVPFE